MKNFKRHNAPTVGFRFKTNAAFPTFLNVFYPYSARIKLLSSGVFSNMELSTYLIASFKML